MPESLPAASAASPSPGHQLINPAAAGVQLTEGTSATLKLYLNATIYFTVPAIIDDVSYEVDINDGDVVGGSANFSCNGARTNP